MRNDYAIPDCDAKIVFARHRPIQDLTLPPLVQPWSGYLGGLVDSIGSCRCLQLGDDGIR